MSDSPEQCHLCASHDCSLVCEKSGRHFYLCTDCRLVFVPKKEFLTFDDERKRYDLHQNDDSSESYRKYLKKIADEVTNIPTAEAAILDFGAGRDHVLTRILRERGYDCQAYDPLYELGSDSLEKDFDLIVLCEVIEHLRNLPAEIELLKKLLSPEGYLYVRTQLYPPLDQFSKWWYINDLTHIHFFTETTLQFLARSLGRQVLDCDGKQTATIGPR